MEEGVGARPGAGGLCLFVNGTVGGLMTPLGVTVTDDDGVDWSGDNFDKADAIGRVVGGLALDALDAADDVADPDLRFRSTRFLMPVENFAFQALFLIGIFDRQLHDYDPDQEISETNLPKVETRIDLVEVGPLSMLTVPGELAPEVAIGGYDGSHVNTTEDELIDPDNENPPDLSQAPPGPYLKDRMDGVENWIIGLGNDELGYLIPAYDYKLSETAPYLEEAPGDHYEETNSIGPSATPLVEEMATRLIEWAP
ncbi:MAG: hypothetical protein D6798_07605 [Deltaproteobacteria bacterium]|nr:MAG: hypothetical protein D6798_07605 [Deltaproteobacteria bacterium]